MTVGETFIVNAGFHCTTLLLLSVQEIKNKMFNFSCKMTYYKSFPNEKHLLKEQLGISLR